jgi:hypothetical protein
MSLRPIVVLSFSRPRYLAQVLDSLLAQHGGVGDRPIALFQDGTWSPTMHTHHADPSDIKECVALFRARFPRGEVFESALNFDRAERYVFETLRAPAGIFMEDDLVLGPTYLTVLEHLVDLALANRRIGYVAAFGNFLSTPEEQRSNARALRPLHLLWGLGLTRRNWLRCRRYIEPYLEIVRRTDYRERNVAEIHKLCDLWGVQPGDTGQDRMKSFATALAGAVKLNTEVAYAQYIGETGVTFTPEMFDRLGFRNHRPFQEVLSLDFDLASVNFDPWAYENNVWRSRPLPRMKKWQQKLVAWR